MSMLVVSVKASGKAHSRRHYVLLVMACCWLFTAQAWAQSGQAGNSSTDDTGSDCTDLFPEDNLKPAPPEFFSFLDEPKKSISSGLEAMARSIDEFFANENVFYASTNSNARVSIETLSEEGGKITTVGKLDVSLHLPATEKKLDLVLESDPTEKQSTEERATSVTQQKAANQKYYAGVQAIFGDLEKWQFKPGVGLKLHLPLEYYVRLRATRDINFGKWLLRLNESAYWYDASGTGFDSELEWNHLIDDDLLFRSTSLVRRTQQYHRFDLSQTFSFTQTLSSRRVINYSLSFLGNSEPTLHATDYIIQARYRQIVHSDFFFMELVPQIRYRIDNAFTQEDSFLVRFEWLFQK